MDPDFLRDPAFVEPFLIWTPTMTDEGDPDEAIEGMIVANGLLDDALLEGDLTPVLDCLADQGRDPVKYWQSVEQELRLRYYCPELIGLTIGE